MQFAVVLESSGAELERQLVTLEGSAEDNDDQIAAAAEDVICGWTLSLGDTIRIIEVL
jgi:hypothetical protein